ncbi:PAS domain S-box protein [Candidatus Latescibacterota bacterium]
MTDDKKKSKAQLIAELEELQKLCADKDKIIVEHENSLKELLNADERFRLLYDSTPTPYQSLDINGKFLEANNAWLEALGYKQDEVIGKWFGDFLAPEYVEQFKKNFPLYKKRGYVNDIEFELLKKDGSRINVSFDGKIGHNPDGTFRQTHCVWKDITDLKKAEVLLRESIEGLRLALQSQKKSEEQFIAFFDNSPVGLGIWDREFRYVYINNMLQKINGPSIEEQIGKTILEVLPNSGPIIITLFQKILSTGKSFLNMELEGEVPSRPGEISHFLVSYFPISIVNGKPLYIGGTILDITERKRASEAVKESNRLLNRVGDIAKIGGWEMDMEHDGKASWTKATYDIIEVPPGDPIPNSDEHVNWYLPEYRAMIKSKMQNLLTTNKPMSFDAAYKTKNGELKWVQAKGETVVKDGKVVKLRGTLQDITDRVTNERALKESEELLNSFMDSATEGFSLLDNKLNLLLSNNTALKISGLKRKEAIGKNIVELSPNIKKSVRYRKYLEVLKTGKPFHIEENVCFPKKGNGCLSIKAFKVGINLGIIIADITKQKKAEQALSESEEKYRLLFDNMQNAFALHEIVVDEKNKPVDYIFLAVNKEFEKQTGLKKESIVGKRVTEVLPGIEKDPSDWIGVYGKVALTGKKISFENYSEPLDKWYDVISFRPVHGQFATVFSNITKRKKAENALKESEDFLNRTGEISKVGGWNIDFETNKLLWTRTTGRIYELPDGYYPDLEEAINYCHPDDREILRNAVNRSVEDCIPDNIEVRIITAKGTERWVRLIGQPVHKDGKCVRLSGTLQDITEQKKIETELRNSKNEFENIFNLSPDMIAIANSNTGYLLKINESWVKILGYSIEELLSKPLLEFVHPDDIESTISKIENQKYGESAVNFENRYLHKNGSYCWISWNATPTHDGLLFAVGRDVTQQMEQRAQLLKSEASLKEAQRIAHLGSWSWDVTTGSVDWTEEVYKIYGLDPNEFEPQIESVMSRFHPDDQEISQQLIQQSIKDHKPFTVKVRIILPSGEICNILSTSEPEFDENGKLSRITGTVQDITESERAEQALRISEERYRRLYKSVQAGVVLQSSDGTILHANKTACEILKMKMDEITRRTSMNLEWQMTDENGVSVPGNKHPAMITLKTGKPIRNAVRKLFSDDSERSLWLLINTEPIFYDSKKKPGEVLTTFIDITEQKKAEEILKIHNEALAISEERYSEVINNMSSAVAVYEAVDNGNDFVIKEFNRRGEEIEQVIRKDIVGKKVTEVFPGAEEFGIFEVFKRVWKTGKPETFPAKIYKDNRIEGWRDNFIYRLSSGEVVAIYDDVTEQKIAEELTKKSYQLLADAQRIAHVGSWSWDVTTGSVDWTDQVYEIFGLDPNEFEPQIDSVVKRFHPDDQEIAQHLIQQSIKNHTPFTVKSRIILPSGEIRNIFSTSQPEFDENGELIRIAGTMQDITESERAEEALRFSEERYRSLYDNIPNLYLSLNPNGIIVDCGGTGAVRLGYTKEELIGQSMDSIFTKDSLIGFKEDFPKLLEKGLLYDVERCLKTKTGEIRTFVLNAEVDYDIDGKPTGTRAIYHDITELRQIQKQLLSHQEKLRSLTRQNYLIEDRERRRISIYLHDQISQELVALRMKFGVLRKQCTSGETDNLINDINELIENAVENTRTLTFDLSSPVLNELGLVPATEWLCEKISQDHNLKISLKSDSKPMIMDDDLKNMIYRSIRELINNVVKHAQASKAKISITHEENMLRINVKDNGIGFNKSPQEALLGEEGGFGIFSIREQLEYVGGHLEITSKSGKGTVISLSVPL